jgi:hypothetical protein
MMEVTLHCKCPECGFEFEETGDVDIEPAVNEGFS